jgi:signal peptidase I
MLPNTGWDLLASYLLTQQLAAGKVVRLSVTTTSMAPFLQPGDRLLLSAVTSQSLQVGDIVALAVLPLPLVHRLVALMSSGSNLLLVTKGDSGATCDRPLPPAALLGRVVAVERAGGRLELTSLRARLVARLLAALSSRRAGTARLHPVLLRCAMDCLLRLAMHALAGLAWSTGWTAADCCATRFELRP